MGLLEALFGTRQTQTTVITDVTRMSGRKICVAALTRGRAIRLAEPHPTEDWLESVGGLIPGNLISVDWQPTRTFKRPHVEDGTWKPASFKKNGVLTYEDFIFRLSAAVEAGVKEAFGDVSAYSERGNPAFSPGEGPRSLASIQAENVRVYPHEEGIRIDFSDGQTNWKMVPVEDLALRRHQVSCPGCAGNMASALLREFGSDEAILRVGLGRPFQARDDLTACFLQVNHIFPLAARSKHFSS